MSTGRLMGLGVIGKPDLTFKRKFRWTFVIEANCSNGSASTRITVPEHFVKVAARPAVSIEETEINFLNAKGWIPGKATWEQINVSYHDVANHAMAPLYSWMASTYNFTNGLNPIQGERGMSDSKGILTMFDGCGKQLEMWELHNLFPTNINFGDLNYEDSSIVSIDLTLRYSSVLYKNFCHDFNVMPCCTDCRSA